MKIFETEFPSLKGKETPWGIYSESIISKNCLDKAKVRETITNFFMLKNIEWRYKQELLKELGL